MSNLYLTSCAKAEAAIREAMRLAPTEDLRGLWEAALGRAVLAAGKAPKRVTRTRIDDLLSRAGLTQRAAARVLEIDERTMRRYVLGESTMPDMLLGRLERLAEEGTGHA